MGIIHNLVGQRFGRLIVLQDTGERKDRCVMWLCQCNCGESVAVRGASLVSGLTQSCGCYKRERSSDKKNAKNPMWRGASVSLGALHDWVKRRKAKPELCELCSQRKPQDLANVSGEYKRDVNDFQWICRKCHMKSDLRMGARKSNGQFERVIRC